ncbi:MAG TPA: iron-sulfur cluster assembly protein [Anaerolineales bacterium]|nr:iron-sulfur cluster assembly protein [Anaerolineales bacterium]
MSEETQYKVIWQAESTHPKLASELRESLREVVDPEIGIDIIDLGLVRDVTIEDDKAKINMILTTPFCPYGPAMLETTRQTAQRALDRPVQIEMGMEMWDMSMMEEGAGGDWGMF